MGAQGSFLLPCLWPLSHPAVSLPPQNCQHTFVFSILRIERIHPIHTLARSLRTAISLATSSPFVETGVYTVEAGLEVLLPLPPDCWLVCVPCLPHLSIVTFIIIQTMDISRAEVLSTAESQCSPESAIYRLHNVENYKGQPCSRRSVSLRGCIREIHISATSFFG